MMGQRFLETRGAKMGLRVIGTIPNHATIQGGAKKISHMATPETETSEGAEENVELERIRHESR
jgi:hypothetical protein